MRSVDSFAAPSVRRFCSRDCGVRGAGDWRLLEFPRGDERNRGIEKVEAGAFCFRLKDILLYSVWFQHFLRGAITHCEGKSFSSGSNAINPSSVSLTSSSTWGW